MLIDVPPDFCERLSLATEQFALTVHQEGDQPKFVIFAEAFRDLARIAGAGRCRAAGENVVEFRPKATRPLQHRRTAALNES